MEQGRPDEALAALQQSMALWYVPHPDTTAGQAAAAQPPAGGKAGGKKGGKTAAKQQQQPQGQRAVAEEQPSYEFRLECVKLLLELDDTIETAAEVLQTCGFPNICRVGSARKTRWTITAAAASVVVLPRWIFVLTAKTKAPLNAGRP